MELLEVLRAESTLFAEERAKGPNNSADGVLINGQEAIFHKEEDMFDVKHSELRFLQEADTLHLQLMLNSSLQSKYLNIRFLHAQGFYSCDHCLELVCVVPGSSRQLFV